MHCIKKSCNTAQRSGYIVKINNKPKLNFLHNKIHIKDSCEMTVAGSSHIF